MHSAAEMFRLVNDIAAYPAFLPWCAGAKVLSESEAEIVASLDVAKGGLKKTFTTRNTLEGEGVIAMELVDGPFESLSGTWRFKALNETACKVELDLEFEFSGRLIAMAMGPIFNEAANTMVDAFCKRADEVYGAG